jgi:hypothetical protein
VLLLGVHSLDFEDVNRLVHKSLISAQNMPLLYHMFHIFRRVRKIAKSVFSVRPSVWNNSAPNGGILMKLDI